MNTKISILWCTLSLLCITSTALAKEQSFRHRIHNQALIITTEDDIKAEISFGQNVAARILGQYKLYNDPDLNRYINLVGTALAINSGRGELGFHFAILDSDNVNAYSAPGGYIFITRGALSLMEDEAELAAVLAHEIAHVSERHIVNTLNIRAKDNSASSGLSRLIGASNSTTQVAFFQAIDKAVEILFSKGYQQQDELDSDRIATLLLATTGYDPLALKRYLQRTRTLNDESAQAINTTHPPSDQRLLNIDRTIDEEALDAVNFSKIQTRFKQYVKQSK